MSNGRMTEELEKFWKKMVITQLKYYDSICLEGLRKTMKTSIMIASVLAEIQT
jgi:hypothetical protein